MAVKTDTEVIIGGRVLTLSGYESEEYLQKVASYINNKLAEYNRVESFRRQPADIQNILVELNIADDYFKAKKQIEEMEEKEIREEFDAIHVHQTEISRYDKNPGKCRIRIQSSVEYLHTLRTPDRKKNVEREKEQHRFNMELVYIQDITKIRDGETAIGVSCPHCGAPIAGLGDRVCPYCGGAVEPVNVRVWELHRIEEV